VEELRDCFHFARDAGAFAVMVSSGPRPDREADDPACLACLADSLQALHQAEPALEILLEPGDRDVEYRHLLGPARMSADFAKTLVQTGLPLGLIFDISHSAQLGEDPYEAWETVKPYCRHVHLANCVLVKGSPIYGDKHPFFGVKDGVYSHDDARKFLSVLEAAPEPLRVTLEMICPAGEEEEDFFRRLVEDTEWFFSKEVGTG
jgi:sugar phosphate isomerase/epimerase